MQKVKDIKMIEELTNALGVSGFEDPVLEVIRKYCDDLGSVEEDSLRNLYLHRKRNTGNKPVIQLDAHSDEVGFMVQSIRPTGMLQIIPLGSWITHTISSQKVWVRNSEGEYIPGIVGSKPPHYMSDQERNSPLDMRQITVDVGATSREEAIKEYKIRIGEPIIPNVIFEYIEKRDLMIGKALDNRLGCASIISTLEELKEEELAVDLIGVFASQEELGARGATVASRKVCPDLAIVFEGCPADDTFVDSYEVQTVMKKGPMLRHIDAKMVTNPRFQRYALNTAYQHQIPVQEAVRTIGSTNSAAIHLTKNGVPTIVIGTPVRYPHTHHGLSAYQDYQYGVKLACEIIRSMNSEIIKSF